MDDCYVMLQTLNMSIRMLMPVLEICLLFVKRYTDILGYHTHWTDQNSKNRQGCIIKKVFHMVFHVVPVMICHLRDAKPLPEAIMNSDQLDLLEETLVKFESKYEDIGSTNAFDNVNFNRAAISTSLKVLKQQIYTNF